MWSRGSLTTPLLQQLPSNQSESVEEGLVWVSSHILHKSEGEGKKNNSTRETDWGEGVPCMISLEQYLNTKRKWYIRVNIYFYQRWYCMCGNTRADTIKHFCWLSSFELKLPAILPSYMLDLAHLECLTAVSVSHFRTCGGQRETFFFLQAHQLYFLEKIITRLI